ncbi:MAG: BTAD domain-containing putative transcriptional regulator, partial [Acidimicrobiales bacterium]|nr:BTAD domain-containing putative transcriptional regulator [Acidimicrobiales bacterium]
MADSDVVRVRLLGELHVEASGGLVRSTDMPGRQGRLVLARLALSQFPVPRDELASIVWPDALPKSWERDLSAVVSKLRALLTGVGFDDAIANAFGCYQLKPFRVRVDILEASEWLEGGETAWRNGDVAHAQIQGDTAVEMFRREFFAGEDSEWIAAQRVALSQLRYRALALATDAHRARGMFPEANRYARRMIEEDPYREQGYAALVRVLLAAGDRASALQAYQRARSFLIDELGVSPSDALEAAYFEALNADPEPAEAA